MTQVTNYAVANGPRAEVRQSFNSVLAALRDFNAGSNPPPNPVAGMAWLDQSVTPSTLRIRNDQNNAWLSAFDAWIAGELTLGPAAALPARGATTLLGSAGWNFAQGAFEMGNTTFWPRPITHNGVTWTPTSWGIDPATHEPFMEGSVVGTAGGNSFLNLYAAAFSRVAVTTGQQFTASVLARITGGTTPTDAATGIAVSINDEIAPVTFVSANASAVQRPTAETPVLVTRTVPSSGGINQLAANVYIRTSSGVSVNYTIRIKGFQFERAATRTSGAFRELTQAEARAAAGLGFAVPFSNLSANGEERLPSGLIVKWGTVNTTTGTTPIIFPVAFPNAIVFQTANANSNAFGPGAENANAASPTLSGMNIISYVNNSGGAVGMVSWIAIGY